MFPVERKPSRKKKKWELRSGDLSSLFLWILVARRTGLDLDEYESRVSGYRVLPKGTSVALLAGGGVLVVALLLGVYWQNIAAWIKFVRMFEHIGTNEQGYPEYRHRQTGIVMVRVPGGTFLMATAGLTFQSAARRAPLLLAG